MGAAEGLARLADLLDQLQTELLQKTEPADAQLITGAITGVGALTYVSGQTSTSGNTTLLTPAGSNRIRVYYASYNPLLAVEAAFRFGATGTLWLRNNITANSVIAKDFGDFRFVQGAASEALILNLSLGVATNWNVLYVEV